MILGSNQCSPFVAYIIQKWEDISRYVEKEIKSWRALKIAKIADYSQELVLEITGKFRDDPEVSFKKDIWYDSWKSIGIKIIGKEPWYYPFALIQLCVFNITVDAIISEFERKSNYIDAIAFIDTCIRLENSISVDFNRVEIDFLNYVMFTRNDSIWKIPTFEELGRMMSSNLPETNTIGAETSRYRTRGQDYWKKLDKFFSTGIFIDHGKIGLSPVVVKHSRTLTELELDYTSYSFFDRGDYFSLLFIPVNSTWVKENEDDHFKSLGTIKNMEAGWNLTHFTGKTRKRWGSYPGLIRKSIDKKPEYTIIYDRKKKVNTGFQEKDFKLLVELSRTLGRIITTARQLEVSEPYIHQRTSFLSENKVFLTKVDLHYSGLDIGLFLVFYTGNEKGKEILHDVCNNLRYLPNYIIYSSENCLFAKIRIPSKWLLELITETDELTSPDGAFHENIISFRMKNYRTRNCIRKGLYDLSDLAIFQRMDDARNRIDWTFEIAK